MHFNSQPWFINAKQSKCLQTADVTSARSLQGFSLQSWWFQWNYAEFLSTAEKYLTYKANLFESKTTTDQRFNKHFCTTQRNTKYVQMNRNSVIQRHFWLWGICFSNIYLVSLHNFWSLSLTIQFGSFWSAINVF